MNYSWLHCCTHRPCLCGLRLQALAFYNFSRCERAFNIMRRCLSSPSNTDAARHLRHTMLMHDVPHNGRRARREMKYSLFPNNSYYKNFTRWCDTAKVLCIIRARSTVHIHEAWHKCIHISSCTVCIAHRFVHILQDAAILHTVTVCIVDHRQWCTLLQMMADCRRVPSHLALGKWKICFPTANSNQQNIVAVHSYARYNTIHERCDKRQYSLKWVVQVQLV